MLMILHGIKIDSILYYVSGSVILSDKQYTLQMIDTTEQVPVFFFPCLNTVWLYPERRCILPVFGDN
jgi:hypothetical protein